MRKPRLASIIFAVICVCLGHAAYLITLGFTAQLTDMLPPAAAPVFDNPYVPPEFSWPTILRQMLPWNLPAMCAVIHGMIVVLIIRGSSWVPIAETDFPHPVAARSRRVRGAWIAAPILLALAIPAVGSLRFAASTLAGKQLVAYQHDQIDFAVAEHDAYGQQSAGMFGLLPSLTESLGGQLRISTELTDEELQQADALLLLHPNQVLAKQQERIWQYVRDGGSVLVVSNGFNPEFGLDDSARQLLANTAISISLDAATSETGHWQESFLVAEHPTTATTDVRSARVLSDYGASLQVGWGARPLVIGQWGWSAPQQDATWDESQPLRTGERLGDLVLAAEQRIGKGILVVLGTDSCLVNEGLVKGYPFVVNLFAYLTHRGSGPQVPWRQALGLVCSLAVIVLLVTRPNTAQLVSVSILLAAGFAGCRAVNEYVVRVIPDGQRISPLDPASPVNSLAYIDQSHLEAYSLDDWGFDSLNGLPLNLMRNGYLPLMLPQLTAERLEKAGLIISIAPARPFTVGERALLRAYVEQGGIFICAVGAEQAAASTTLLADFGLHVPVSPVPTEGHWYEPEPFGRTHALYLSVKDEDQGDYAVGIRLHAAWPVESLDDGAEVLAYGHNQLRIVDSDTELPVVLSREVGRGQVVLIGDTGFAMNKNLEYVGGEPFSGGYENAHFWRWLIGRLTGQAEWTPPRPVASPAAGEESDAAETMEEDP